MKKKETLPTGVKGSCNVAALAELFNTDWYYQPVLKGEALATVVRTGTKGGPLVPEGQHQLGNRGRSRPVPMPNRAAVSPLALALQGSQCIISRAKIARLKLDYMRSVNWPCQRCTV